MMMMMMMAIKINKKKFLSIDQVQYLNSRPFIERIHPNPKTCVTFHISVISYCEELLAPHPHPKLEVHILSAVHDCLLNIFTATHHIWRSSRG
jgi:hypothetical protein